MGRAGYVPSLLCAELVMCRVCYVPSCPTMKHSLLACAIKGNGDQSSTFQFFRVEINKKIIINK